MRGKKEIKLNSILYRKSKLEMTKKEKVISFIHTYIHTQIEREREE